MVGGELLVVGPIDRKVGELRPCSVALAVQQREVEGQELLLPKAEAIRDLGAVWKRGVRRQTFQDRVGSWPPRFVDVSVRPVTQRACVADPNVVCQWDPFSRWFGGASHRGLRVDVNPQRPLGWWGIEGAEQIAEDVVAASLHARQRRPTRAVAGLVHQRDGSHHELSFDVRGNHTQGSREGHDPPSVASQPQEQGLVEFRRREPAGFVEDEAADPERDLQLGLVRDLFDGRERRRTEAHGAYHEHEVTRSRKP